MCFLPPFFFAQTVYAIAMLPWTPALCTACIAASLLITSISSTVFGTWFVNAKHIIAQISPSSSFNPYIFLPYACPILEQSNISIKDQLSTFTEHVAIQLSKQLKENSKVLVTGGGAFNRYLLKRILPYFIIIIYTIL